MNSFDINPALIVFQKQIPEAEIRLNGLQLHWMDGERENSITFFPDKQDLDNAKMAAGSGMEREVVFVGNFRFSSTK
jgi:hypothetical protein